VPMVMFVSIGCGAVSVVLGLAISFHYDTAGGATMAGLSVLQFFLVFAYQEIRASLRNDQPAVAA
ncbi:MAG: metal ABC transporter permease, partial [Actinomycetota bacterium]